MSMIEQTDRHLRQARSAAAVPPRRRALPQLLGLGLAVPQMSRSQSDTEPMMAELWGLSGAALERWRRIVAGSEILTRHAVLPPNEVVHLTTSQRMVEYHRLAPPLAAQAAQRALANAAMTPAQVTDLIVVSCTGFAAPGLDVALVESLGLRTDVRRTLIGFMGCFGAISGLRTAVGACAANADSGGAVALVVCLELCSLHMRADADVQNQVASALFADGAAAAVVASVEHDAGDERGRDDRPCLGRLTSGASLLIPEGREWMTWRITDAGFAMTLTRQVPQAMRQSLGGFVAQTYPRRPRLFVIHPGGPGILDAADEALNLRGAAGLEVSRAVLQKYGNMSSATVLFVLDQALRCGAKSPALLLAFGPGLTIESIPLLPDDGEPWA